MDKEKFWKAAISAIVAIISALVVVFQTQNSQVNEEVQDWNSSFSSKINSIQRSSVENHYRLETIEQRLGRIEKYFYTEKLNSDDDQ